jgi:predicted alternative tryptophan synthase beta-subunit
VRVSYDQKPYRRHMMETWGAKVVASPSPDTNAGRARLAAAGAADPGQAAGLTALERDLTRLYYTGRFAEYVARIGDVPSQ